MIGASTISSMPGLQVPCSIVSDMRVMVPTVPSVTTGASSITSGVP